MAWGYNALPQPPRNMLPTHRPLAGRVALVTGGGVRLGRALALGLGKLGADVAVHHHGSAEGAREVAGLISVDGNRAAPFAADLTADAAPEALVARVEEALGPITVLVNSAALFVRGSLDETTLEAFDAQWRLNARAPWLLTRAVAARLKGLGKTGDVLNVLDIGGAFTPWKHYSAYCMTKAALRAMTECLAVELAPAVRVNGVAPGTVLPPEGLNPSELSDLQSRIPAGRFGSPEDVVEAAAFLLSGPAFVTGQIVRVDGGRALASGASAGSRGVR
jgi:pteridine reductase